MVQTVGYSTVAYILHVLDVSAISPMAIPAVIMLLSKVGCCVQDRSLCSTKRKSLSPRARRASRSIRSTRRPRKPFRCTGEWPEAKSGRSSS